MLIIKGRNALRTEQRNLRGHEAFAIDRAAIVAKDLADAGIAIRTVCQAAIGTLPRLKDDDTKIRFESSPVRHHEANRCNRRCSHPRGTR